MAASLDRAVTCYCRNWCDVIDAMTKAKEARFPNACSANGSSAPTRMLTDPRFAGRSITSVAFDAGFGDVSYFNRSFRCRFGPRRPKFVPKPNIANHKRGYDGRPTGTSVVFQIADDFGAPLRDLELD
jgi:hypothetical protein